jgi:hypothetical protein
MDDAEHLDFLEDKLMTRLVGRHHCQEPPLFPASSEAAGDADDLLVGYTRQNYQQEGEWNRLVYRFGDQSDVSSTSSLGSHRRLRVTPESFENEMDDPLASPIPALHLSHNGKMTRTPSMMLCEKQCSNLNVHSSTDPFSEREGKELTWQNVNLSVVRCIFVSMISVLRARFSFLLTHM